MKHISLTGEKRKRVRLAKTGEDSKVQPEDIVNSFNLMDNGSAGVYSRSGESGGGGSGGVYCALCNKLNCNGSCEVTVIYCRNCNRPADNCICCPICRDYPCRCYTPPSPPPQWPCSYCGSTVCPGNCQTGGGGGGTTLPLLKIRVLTPRPVVPGEVAVVAVPRVGVYVNAWMPRNSL